jgi:hypothetical protein
MPEASRCTTALADDAAPLALGRAAPDASLLPVGQRVLETRAANAAQLAHLLRHLGRLVVFRIEDRRFQASACPEHAPFEFVR